MTTPQLSLLTILEQDRPPETQRERVLAILLKGGWWTFGEIKAEIWAHYGRTDSEAGISARIRELAHDKRVRKGCRNLYEYRLVTAKES